MGASTSCCEGPAVVYNDNRKMARKRSHQQMLRALEPLASQPQHSDGQSAIAGVRLGRRGTDETFDRRDTVSTSPASAGRQRSLESAQHHHNPFLPSLPPVSPATRSPRIVAARDGDSMPEAASMDPPTFSASGSRSNRTAAAAAAKLQQNTSGNFPLAGELSSSTPFKPIHLLGSQTSELESGDALRSARSDEMGDDFVTHYQRLTGAAGVPPANGMSPIFSAMRHNHHQAQQPTSQSQSQSRNENTTAPTSLVASFAGQPGQSYRHQQQHTPVDTGHLSDFDL